MANELRARHPAFGLTVYALLLRASDGQAYKGGGAFEPPAAQGWALYAVPAVEQDAAHGTGLYYASMPGGLPAGLYEAWLYSRLGATPAPTDTLIAQQSLDWGGAAELGTYAAYAVVMQTPMAEAYATRGAAPTLEQMQFMAWAALSEFGVVGTTLTCRRLDDATAAMTFTLDSAAAPTNRTRAS
jgi:hypothetical protein